MSVFSDLPVTGQVRPLLWLAEACIAAGVTPCSMSWKPWVPEPYEIQVASVADLERVAAHLCLDDRDVTMHDGEPSLLNARGRWLDEIAVHVFTGMRP